MPLIKGTSQKSFDKNIKTEMDHGHPQKQSLAIAYSMKRKAEAAQHKMAMGGECPSCGYAEGGSVEGVHKSAFNYPVDKEDEGKSSMGNAVRHGDMETAKMRAYDVLKEGRNVAGGHSKKPLEGLAMGGELKSGYEEMPEDDVKHNEMAMHEDNKDLNQHSVMAMDSGEDDMVDRIMKKRDPTFENEARLSEGGQVANDTHPFESDFESPNEFDDLVLRDNDMEDADYTGANSGDELGNEQEDEDRHDIVSRIMASRRKRDRMPSPA